MPSLYEFRNMSLADKQNWERIYSSYIRENVDITYKECRELSTQSISEGTKITIKKGEIIEIPKGTPFHFIGRVDTSGGILNPYNYYKTYEYREFVSYSTISNKNISHYPGKFFFIYNIFPEDIVHIFPMDSDTKPDAYTEEVLTKLPSLWITLQELENFSLELEVYNQITVKTKRNGKIIKPSAVAAFGEKTDAIQKIADLFEIGIILINADDNAINYTHDLLRDYCQLKTISKTIENKLGFSVISLYYD